MHTQVFTLHVRKRQQHEDGDCSVVRGMTPSCHSPKNTLLSQHLFQVNASCSNRSVSHLFGQSVGQIISESDDKSWVIVKSWYGRV